MRRTTCSRFFAALNDHQYASGRGAARDETQRTQMAAALEQDAQNAPAAPDAASAAPEEPTAAAPRERVRVAVRVRPLTEGAKRATACATAGVVEILPTVGTVLGTRRFS